MRGRQSRIFGSALYHRIIPMPLDIRLSRTATDKLDLIVGSECEWQDFPDRATAIVDHFRMTVVEKIADLNELLWIVTLDDAQFCISWDIWIPDVSIMAWEDTPDTKLEQMIACESP
jgi:hypothetical protein